MIKHLTLFLAIGLLAGCGEKASQATTAINKIRDNCRGALTMTVTLSSWDEQLVVSCTENVDEESRAKRKDMQ